MSNDETIIYDNPEVLTKGDRIHELESELSELRGENKDMSSALVQLIGNPSAIRSKLALNPQQQTNLKALIVAAGSGFSMKYLSRHLGDEVAAGIGAIGAAYLARKLLG